MTFGEFRQPHVEQLRVADLLANLPWRSHKALDVGTRDGYIASELAKHFNHVTALDLVPPDLSHPRITCVGGDAACLPFDSDSFDLVLCSEVLEHIPETQLSKACQELARVSSSHVLIGVPFRQDLRCARTRCQSCGHRNPPWGHVNSFDEERLLALFSSLQPERISFVGQTKEVTNAVSTFLMDLAGNPYGTYEQDEPCVVCGATLRRPAPPGLLQKVPSKIAVTIDAVQNFWTKPRGNWIHVLFRKIPNKPALDNRLFTSALRSSTCAV